MRIIGGYASGVNLVSPPVGPGFKPTMDRVRESIAASLEPWLGLTVVDLFACSGALGLEALSRGAGKVAWFEQDPRNCRIIRQNLDLVTPHLPTSAKTEVFQADVLNAPQLLSGWQPDIILADPPYNPQRNQKGAVDLLSSDDMVAWAGSAWMVMEQSKHNPLEPECMERWEVARLRRYGSNLVYFLKARA